MRKLGKLGLAGLTLLAGCGINQVIPEHITLSDSHKFLLGKARTELTQWQWEKLEHFLEQEREELEEELEERVDSYLDPILKKTDSQGKEIKFRPRHMNNVNMLGTRKNKQRVILHQLSRFDHAKECKDGFLKGGMITIDASYDNQRRWHILNILHLNSIQRGVDSDVASLRNGTKLRGRWIGNQETSDIYGLERGVASTSVEGISGDKYLKVPIRDIQEIFFDTDSARIEEIPEKRKPTPRRVELRDGTVFTTPNSFVVDYYIFHSASPDYGGSSRRSSSLWRKLQGNEVISQQPTDTTTLETFIEVEFTGRFVPEDSQNRQVVYTLKDGSKRTGVLRMSREKEVVTHQPPPTRVFAGIGRTYSVPSSEKRYYSSDSRETGRDFDKFYIERPWGATLVPLDDVRRVTVILEAELQEIPQPFTGD